MKNRALALLLTAAMLLGSLSGCGNAEQLSGENSQNTEIAEATALSLMGKYNIEEAQVSYDNYRTYYEVFVYSFYDSDEDGVGDLNGLTQMLDYINDGDPKTTVDLGCDGIWLMPIMPSTTYHKYDVIDYCDIDPEYGTLEDFKAFVAACNERGIRVMIDLVMNHSSSQHEWFKTACDYLRSLPEGAEPDVNDCPYVDYYHFSRDAQDGYSKVAGANWYYEAQFWSEMPDLNLANEALRAEFEAVVDFWLDLGVTGFRLDAAKEYYSGNDSKNIEVLTWFYDMVKAKNEDVYIVAEVWNNISSYSTYHASGVSCFNFSFADNSGVIATALKQGNGNLYADKIISAQEAFAASNPDYIDSPFYTNHDMGRSTGYYVGEYSENQVKMAQAMNLLMSGSAFLYYGEELGMKGSGKDENKRAPMYWSMDENTVGMCDGPSDMDNVEMKFESFAEQNADGNSIYNFVKQTILLRNQYPALSHGVAEIEEGLMDVDGICALKKTYEDESVLLIYNLAAENTTIDLANVTLVDGELEIGGVLFTGTEDILVNGTEITLPPYTVIVVK